MRSNRARATVTFWFFASGRAERSPLLFEQAGLLDHRPPARILVLDEFPEGGGVHAGDQHAVLAHALLALGLRHRNVDLALDLANDVGGQTRRSCRRDPRGRRPAIAASSEIRETGIVGQPLLGGTVDQLTVPPRS